MAFLCCCW